MRDRAPHGKPTRRSAMRSPRSGPTRPSLERAQRHDGMRSQAPTAPRFAATSRHSPLAEAVHRHIGLPWSNQRALSDDCPSMRICPPHPASRRGLVRRVPSRYGNVSGTLPTISFELHKRGTPVRSDGSHVTTVPASSGHLPLPPVLPADTFETHPPPPRKPHVCGLPLHAPCTDSLRSHCIASGSACMRRADTTDRTSAWHRCSGFDRTLHVYAQAPGQQLHDR